MNRGFTLIELLISVAILAILASVALTYCESRIEILVNTMEDTITRALHHHFELSLARRDHAATII